MTKQSTTESIHGEIGIKIYKHKHHIIPKHAGGNNDTNNIIELTVEEHAEAHRILYEQHGRWQDKVAWLSLSGRIDNEESARLAASYAMKNRPRTSEEFVKGWETRRKNGWKHSEETKKKISGKLTGIKKSERTEKHKKKLSDSVKLAHDENRLSSKYPNLAGTKWWNNGTINKRSAECPGPEWKSGRI